MTQLSGFSRSLLESAKFFFQQSKEENSKVRSQAFLRASLYHALAYVEAQINDIAEHFADSGQFSLHEVGLLLEREVVFENGQFAQRDNLKIARLTDRIDLLSSHFGENSTNLPRYDSLKEALKRRNSLSHPKENVELTESDVAVAIQSAISVCSGLAKLIFGKDLPYVDRGLDPTADYT